MRPAHLADQRRSGRQSPHRWAPQSSSGPVLRGAKDPLRALFLPRARRLAPAHAPTQVQMHFWLAWAQYSAQKYLPTKLLDSPAARTGAAPGPLPRPQTATDHAGTGHTPPSSAGTQPTPRYPVPAKPPKQLPETTRMQAELAAACPLNGRLPDRRESRPAPLCRPSSISTLPTGAHHSAAAAPAEQRPLPSCTCSKTDHTNRC